MLPSSPGPDSETEVKQGGNKTAIPKSKTKKTPKRGHLAASDSTTTEQEGGPPLRHESRM